MTECSLYRRLDRLMILVILGVASLMVVRSFSIDQSFAEESTDLRTVSSAQIARDHMVAVVEEEVRLLRTET